MTLALRIIPCLDVDSGRVVKGTKFLNLVDAGDPVEVAKRYNAEGADEVVFLDITASSQKRNILLDVVRKTAEQVFIPLTVGGGVRTAEDIKTLLRSGADKVSMNTAAVQNPKLISEGAEKFGTQCIVVAIDAKKVGTGEGGSHKKIPSRVPSPKPQAPGSWEVYIHGGRTPTGLNVVAWAKKAEKLGAGEILLTSMDADGTKAGYDTGLLRAVTKAVKIPVIASGGAGTKEHFLDGTKAGASACLAASLFHFKELGIHDLKKYLKQKGVDVRL